MYDFLVIGKGLIGSAAFRHLAERSPNTLLIGPDEPADESSHDGVFGAHYDRARLTHLHGKSPVWGELCRRSIGRYRWLEEASGLEFYEPVGELYLADAGIENTYTEPGNVRSSRERLGVELLDLDHGQRRQRFPYLDVPEASQAIWEKSPAGHINPRLHIEAEIRIGVAAGGEVENDTVIATEVRNDHVAVRTSSGSEFAARRAVVATGSFANCFENLPVDLDVVCKAEHIVLARLGEAERDRLAAMPVMHYDVDSEALADMYLVPPVQYPDGHWYLKLGANTHRDLFLTTLAEMQAWYREGDSDLMLPELQAMVLKMFPGLDVEGWKTGRCVITRTPHKLPMIDAVVPDRLYCAVGGNGSSAACADALGGLAANLVAEGEWTDELTAADFQAHFRAPDHRTGR